MKLTAQQFLEWPHKAITLIGMSGVGKTHFSGMLEKEGWARHSCDFMIGTHYLKEQLASDMKNPEDMTPLFSFLGLLGDPAKGGMKLKDFQRRQKLYYDAECESVASVPGQVKKLQGADFVHDATGSLCEITDLDLLERLGKSTMFVYLKAGDEAEKAVLARAEQHPKPLFFPPESLEDWIAEYLKDNDLHDPEEMDPQAFSRWVFPKLFESRLPKYQALAERYGVAVQASSLQNVKTSADFVSKIAEALA